MSDAFGECAGGVRFIGTMKSVRKTTRTEVTVAAPPSKAHTLRALFLSALADGTSTVHNPLLGEDQQRAIECLQCLGVGIQEHEGSLIVQGTGGRFDPVADELFVGESGVTMNFLAALSCLSPKPVVITGAPRITERPISELVNGLRQLGCKIDYLAKDGFPPIRVQGDNSGRETVVGNRGRHGGHSGPRPSTRSDSRLHPGDDQADKHRPPEAQGMRQTRGDCL